jgi:hypothetical protein
VPELECGIPVPGDECDGIHTLLARNYPIRLTAWHSAKIKTSPTLRDYGWL